MRATTYEEAAAWFQERGWVVGAQGSNTRPLAVVPIPLDSGAKTAMAWGIVSLIGPGQSCALLVHDTDIWPSSANPFLFAAARRGLGCDADIDDWPGHLLDPGEGDALEALLCLCLYFVWGAYLADESGDWLVAISHDEYVACWARDEATLARVRAIVGGET